MAHELVELVETDGGLWLRPLADMHEEIAECKELAEVLEYQLCNGWSWVEPESCGALTEGSILSNDVDVDENGEVTRIGRVYWDSQYMLVDTLEELKKGKWVLWSGHD